MAGFSKLPEDLRPANVTYYCGANPSSVGDEVSAEDYDALARFAAEQTERAEKAEAEAQRLREVLHAFAAFVLAGHTAAKEGEWAQGILADTDSHG